jgi:hypothetical protein
MASWCSWLIWVTLLQRFAGVVVADTNQQELLKWVRAEGGFFHHKLELRSDENGLFGVFAAQDIRKNELLASIPWSCILYSENSDHRFQNCEVVELLEEELHKDAPSPYAQSLKKTARDHASLLPTNWSKKGKELFLKVTGNGTLPPEDPFFDDFEWKHQCEKVSQDATLLVMTHGEDFGMVPLTDKFNNRAGNWTGAFFDTDPTDEVTGLRVFALRDIRAGEQVYTHYKDYGEIGTPELLIDYGFVEMYPQRYILPEWEVAFEVSERDDGSLHVTWLSNVMDVNYDDPDEETAAFLWQQVTRLSSVFDDLKRISSEEGESVPENELQIVTQFCRDYLTALSLAVEDITTCPSDS